MLVGELLATASASPTEKRILGTVVFLLYEATRLGKVESNLVGLYAPCPGLTSGLFIFELGS